MMNENECMYLLDFGFQIISLISDHGYSQVYTIVSAKSGLSYALKRVKDIYVNLKTLQLIKEMNSPKIVNIVDFYQYNGHVYIIMEYCRYELQKYIAFDKNINRTDIAKYLRSCIEAVKACHEAHYFCLNIKPSNFLIDQFGHVKISDIYYTTDYSFIDNPAINLANIMYCAPDLLKRIDPGTMSTDIWSLGCTIYYISTGYAPFKANDKYHLFELINMCEYDKEIINDPLLRELVSMCLNPDARFRFTTESLIVADYFKQFEIEQPNSSFLSAQMIPTKHLRTIIMKKSPIKPIMATKSKMRIKSFSVAPGLMPSVHLPAIPGKYAMN